MKKLLIPALVAGLFSFNAFAAEEEKVAEAKPAIDLTVEPTVFNEDDIRSYGLVEKTVSGDRNADRIFKKYHSNFLKQVKNINREMDRYSGDIAKQIDKEIMTGEKYITADQAKYDENCKEVKTEEQHKSCEDFKEQIFNLTEQVKGLKVQKKNLVEEIEVDRSNRLKKTYIGYKNSVGKLMAEVKENNK